MADEVSACEKKVEEEIENAVSERITSLMKQKHELLEQCHDIARSKQHVLVSRLSSSRKQTNILLPLLQPALVNKVPGKQVINYQCAEKSQ